MRSAPIAQPEVGQQTAGAWRCFETRSASCPKGPPSLPDADDLPEIEADDSFDASLPVDTYDPQRHSTDADISESLEDLSIQSLDKAPRGGPLDFDGGTSMGRRWP